MPIFVHGHQMVGVFLIADGAIPSMSIVGLWCGASWYMSAPLFSTPIACGIPSSGGTSKSSKGVSMYYLLVGNKWSEWKPYSALFLGGNGSMLVETMQSDQELSQWVSARSPACSSSVPARWSVSLRNALVVLWVLLVYPRLVPALRKQLPPQLTVTRLVKQLPAYFVSESVCWFLLHRLMRYDYIRMRGDLITSGTKLWTTLDAKRLHAFATHSPQVGRWLHRMRLAELREGPSTSQRVAHHG